jgi:hypothetical protein
MVAEDGVNSARAGRARRLLRRSLLTGVLAAAGWLLAALFSTPASAATHATELPPQPPRPTPPAAGHAAGLTGLLGSLTNTVTGTVTDTVRQVDHTLGALTRTPLFPSREPLHGNRPLDPLARSAPGLAAPAPTARYEPPATPALPATVAPALAPTPREPADTPRPSTPVRTETHIAGIATGTALGEAHPQAGRHPDRPLRSPAPLAPTATCSVSAHDDSGGARGVLGVLPAATMLPPPAPGYTTRSRAADATGRVAGIPATTPD